MRVIEEVDRSELLKAEIGKFGMPKLTLSRILKHKGKIEDGVKLGNFAKDRLRM